MAEAPERLDLAEDPLGGWWSAADAPPEARVAFVRADIADKYKRQRDMLLDAFEPLMVANDIPARELAGKLLDARRMVRSAIAEGEGQ